MSFRVRGNHIVLVIALFAIFATASTRTSPQAPLSEKSPISLGHGIVGNMSTSTELVDILSYGTHFRIPRNYLYDILYDRRDGSVDFALETLYPDFKGAQSEEEIHKKYGTENGKTSLNLIDIYTSKSIFSPEHDPNTIVFNAESNQPDHPWRYGLLQSMVRSGGLSDVYFERPTKTTKGYVVFCDPDPAMYAVIGCSSHIRLTETLIVQIRFQRELLPHWKEINEHIVPLINSFIIPEPTQ